MNRSQSSSNSGSVNSRDGTVGDDNHYKFPEGEEYPILNSFKQELVQKIHPQNLTSNYFKLSTSRIIIYHYSVQISCDPNQFLIKRDSVESRGVSDEAIGLNQSHKQQEIGFVEKYLRRHATRILEKFLEINSTHFDYVTLYIYDGWTNLFVTKPLPNGFVSQFEYNNEAKPFKMTKVRINFTQTIDMGMIDDYFNKKRQDLPYIVITVLNLLFQNALAKHYTIYQQKFYNIEKFDTHRLFPFLEFVYGFELSTRMAQIGMSLVIIPKVVCLFSRQYTRLIDLVQSIDSKFQVNPNEIDLKKVNFEKINEILRNLRIYTTHGNFHRKYSIHSLIPDTPTQKKFVTQDGVTLSVYEYFLGKYQKRIELKYPLVRTTQNEFIPLELCFVEGKQFLHQSKINSEIQSIIVKKSEFEPIKFFDYIQKYIDHIIKLDSALLKNFGISIHNRPASFLGYQLPQPPMINCNPFKVAESAQSIDWAIVSFDRVINKYRLSNFIKELRNEAVRMDMKLGQLKFADYVRISKIEDIQREFHNLIKDSIKFCFVVIPERHPDIDPKEIYGSSSSFATQQFNIKLQCVNGSRINRQPKGYFTNLLFEVNGKLGGQNSVINPDYLRLQLNKLDFSKTMVIGIDVNHPDLREHICVSIAAASGSYDSRLTKYANSIRVQKRDRTEIINKLDEMLIELLQSYAKHNDKRMPQNLIIFRDGVSENQFDTLKHKELPLIQKVINDQAEETNSQPMKLTLIIVQKRHQTRFVTTKPYKPNPRSEVTQNVPKGTVVDNSIVEPNFDIFYINSHYSRLGTSKPTKYIVIENQLKMTNSELHRLCFFICFNCVRYKYPLSLPTPVLYADLCAYKSKIHIMSNAKYEKVQDPDSDLGIGSNNSQLSIQKDEDLEIKRFQRWAFIEDPESRDSFFYL